MKLDSEEQRALLIQLIDSVPIQGQMSQVLDFALKVHGLKHAVETASLHLSGAQEMMLNR